MLLPFLFKGWCGRNNRIGATVGVMTERTTVQKILIIEEDDDTKIRETGE